MNRQYWEENRKNIVILAILFLFGFIYRLVDYPSNFTPLAAISLFAGFYFKKAWIAFLPVTILFFSDIFIGFYDWKIMAAVYGSFIFIGLMGMLIKKRNFMAKIALSSIAGSFLFFLITNFAVWYFSDWYSRDMQGLSQCFYLAIPFFRNTFLGDLFFSGIIFGCYEFYCIYASNRLKKNRLAVNNFI